MGADILWTGYRLVRGSMSSLLSAAMPADDQAAVSAVLDSYRGQYPVESAPLRTVEPVGNAWYSSLPGCLVAGPSNRLMI